MATWLLGVDCAGNSAQPCYRPQKLFAQFCLACSMFNAVLITVQAGKDIKKGAKDVERDLD